MEATPAELAAVSQVLQEYAKDSEREAARVERNFKSLSADDLASLVIKPEEQVKWIREGIEENQKFLTRLQEQAVRMLKDAKPSDSEVKHFVHRYNRKPAWVLANFMREWSEEGAEERRGSTQYVLGNLEKYVPVSGSPQGPRVMFPDLRLGRVPFEAMQKGYRCEGTETDIFFIMGLELMMQQDHQPGEFKLQPHCLGTCNRTKPRDHVREVMVPDVEVKASCMPHYYHGQFPELFSPSEKSHAGTFDGLVTIFAVDGTANILRFVRAVASILRPGGLWVNFGPLEYRCDDTGGDGTIMELSWEELRHAISIFFDVKDEGFEDCFMATNRLSMMQTEYTAVKFAAIRKENGPDPMSYGLHSDSGPYSSSQTEADHASKDKRKKKGKGSRGGGSGGYA